VPHVFDNIPPGRTYQWGQVITLNWKVGALDKSLPPLVSIVIRSCKVEGEEGFGSLPADWLKAVDEKSLIIKTDVSIRAGKAQFAIAPNQPMFLQRMKTWMELVDTSVSPPNILATSATVCVTRPVTLQNLEVGYASFCIRNQMPQGRLTDVILEEHGVDIQERDFYTVSGYRASLPVPREAELLSAAPQHKLIVKDPGAILISNGVKRDVEIFTADEIKAVHTTAAFEQEAANIAKKIKKEGLKQPLLEGATRERQTSVGSKGSGSSSVADQVPTETMTPQRTTLMIPTNVFWRYDADWSPEVLLWYAMLPDFAVDGYVTTKLQSYEYYKLATLLGRADDLFRSLFRVLIWAMQSIVLGFPAVLFVWLAVYRDSVLADVNPHTKVFENIGLIYLSDFMISPSPFRVHFLDGVDISIFWLIVVYYVFAVFVAFCNNFIRNELQEDSSKLAKALPYIDHALSFVFSMFCFAFLVYLSVVAVWILLGSLIDPKRLMPYALALAGILLIAKTQYANLKMLRDHAESKMHDFLNGAMHAMVSVFVGDTSSGPWLDMGQESQFAEQISELIYSTESEQTKALYKQSSGESGIKTQVSQDEINRYNLLRQSPAFKEGINKTANKTLITDFVAAEIIPIAQKIANDEATINGDRNAADPHTGVVLDNDLTDAAISKAVSSYGAQQVPQPGQITSEQQAKLQKISEKLKMRPETATLLSQAFSLATHLRRSPEEQALLQPVSCAAMMSSIRSEQLFSHFLMKEEDATDTSGKTEKVQVSNAMKMLAEIHNKEMESFNAYTATALTNLVDWVALSRDAQKFLDGTLQIIVGNVVDQHLNEHYNGSAAFDLMLTVYKQAFSPKFESAYKEDPMKFYVDVGLVSASQAASSKCKAILSVATNNNKLFDGSISPDVLINTVVSLFLPSARSSTADVGEVPNPMYLWYGAYKRILTQLGFTKEEMDEAWLEKVWKEHTTGGLFSFRLVDTINTLITATSANGLWQAAAKLLMYQHKIGGYASCDVNRYEKGKDETKEERKEAWVDVHKQGHALFDRAPQPDLAWFTSDCPWPRYIEDLWKKYCEGEKIKVLRPDFLGPTGMMDFLQDVIYVPRATVQVPDPSEFLPLNQYPEDVNDLVWLERSKDKSLWHDLPDGKRRIRGLWHELVMEIWDLMDCVPTDLDIFFKCQKHQEKDVKDLPKREFDEDEPIFLRHVVLSDWLRTKYLPTNTVNATFGQFSTIVCDMLKVEIPKDVLQAKVFAPCPLVKDDDLGELRVLADLAAGLRMFMGMGIWQGGVGQIIDLIMPRGPLRSMAQTSLPSEFTTQDTEGQGILQPAQAVMLVHNLAHPGLTCDDLAITVQNDLGIQVNKREFHHYFTLVDVNCNNVLGLDEFIPFMQMMMLDYFPGKVMSTLNLSAGKVFSFILGIIMVIVMVFTCVTLIMNTFAAGSNVGSALHSAVTAVTVAGSKVQAEASSGFNDAISAVKAALSALMMTTLTGVLGFAPQTIDVFKTTISQLEQGLTLST
jgi:hypothetical protein